MGNTKSRSNRGSPVSVRDVPVSVLSPLPSNYVREYPTSPIERPPLSRRLAVNRPKNTSHQPAFLGRSLPLHCAAFAGDADTCSELMNRDANVDIECRDEGGATPLILAAAEGHAEVCRVLLTAGALITVMDETGDSSFHYACKGGHVETVQVLLDYLSVRVGIENYMGNKNVTDSKMDDIVTKLVMAKGCHGYTIYHYAAEGGYADILRLLFSVAPSNEVLFCTDSTAARQTPLHLAVTAASNYSFELYTQRERGAKISFAETINYEASVLYLLRYGAPVNIVNGYGETPLFAAATIIGPLGIKICKALITCGAHMDALDLSHQTPLHHAAAMNCDDICHVLISCGANTDARDVNNKCPLQFVSHIDVVSSMLLGDFSTAAAVTVLGDPLTNDDSIYYLDMCIHRITRNNSQDDSMRSLALIDENRISPLYEPIMILDNDFMNSCDTSPAGYPYVKESSSSTMSLASAALARYRSIKNNAGDRTTDTVSDRQRNLQGIGVVNFRPLVNRKAKLRWNYLRLQFGVRRPSWGALMLRHILRTTVSKLINKVTTDAAMIQSKSKAAHARCGREYGPLLASALYEDTHYREIQRFERLHEALTGYYFADENGELFKWNNSNSEELLSPNQFRRLLLGDIQIENVVKETQRGPAYNDDDFDDMTMEELQQEMARLESQLAEERLFVEQQEAIDDENLYEGWTEEELLAEMARLEEEERRANGSSEEMIMSYEEYQQWKHSRGEFDDSMEADTEIVMSYDEYKQWKDSMKDRSHESSASMENDMVDPVMENYLSYPEYVEFMLEENPGDEILTEEQYLEVIYQDRLRNDCVKEEPPLEDAPYSYEEYLQGCNEEMAQTGTSFPVMDRDEFELAMLELNNEDAAAVEHASVSSYGYDDYLRDMQEDDPDGLEPRMSREEFDHASLEANRVSMLQSESEHYESVPMSSQGERELVTEHSENRSNNVSGDDSDSIAVVDPAETSAPVSNVKLLVETRRDFLQVKRSLQQLESDVLEQQTKLAELHDEVQETEMLLHVHETKVASGGLMTQAMQRRAESTAKRFRDHLASLYEDLAHRNHQLEQYADIEKLQKEELSKCHSKMEELETALILARQQVSQNDAAKEGVEERVDVIKENKIPDSSIDHMEEVERSDTQEDLSDDDYKISNVFESHPIKHPRRTHVEPVAYDTDVLGRNEFLDFLSGKVHPACLDGLSPADLGDLIYEDYLRIALDPDIRGIVPTALRRRSIVRITSFNSTVSDSDSVLSDAEERDILSDIRCSWVTVGEPRHGCIKLCQFFALQRNIPFVSCDQYERLRQGVSQNLPNYPCGLCLSDLEHRNYLEYMLLILNPDIKAIRNLLVKERSTISEKNRLLIRVKEASLAADSEASIAARAEYKFKLLQDRISEIDVKAKELLESDEGEEQLILRSGQLRPQLIKKKKKAYDARMRAEAANRAVQLASESFLSLFPDAKSDIEQFQNRKRIDDSYRFKESPVTTTVGSHSVLLVTPNLSKATFGDHSDDEMPDSMTTSVMSPISHAAIMSAAKSSLKDRIILKICESRRNVFEDTVDDNEGEVVPTTVDDQKNVEGALLAETYDPRRLLESSSGQSAPNSPVLENAVVGDTPPEACLSDIIRARRASRLSLDTTVIEHSKSRRTSEPDSGEVDHDLVDLLLTKVVGDKFNEDELSLRSSQKIVLATNERLYSIIRDRKINKSKNNVKLRPDSTPQAGEANPESMSDSNNPLSTKDLGKLESSNPFEVRPPTVVPKVKPTIEPAVQTTIETIKQQKIDDHGDGLSIHSSELDGEVSDSSDNISDSASSVALHLSGSDAQVAMIEAAASSAAAEALSTQSSARLKAAEATAAMFSWKIIALRDRCTRHPPKGKMKQKALSVLKLLEKKATISNAEVATAKAEVEALFHRIPHSKHPSNDVSLGGDDGPNALMAAEKELLGVISRSEILESLSANADKEIKRLEQDLEIAKKKYDAHTRIVKIRPPTTAASAEQARQLTITLENDCQRLRDEIILASSKKETSIIHQREMLQRKSALQRRVDGLRSRFSDTTESVKRDAHMSKGIHGLNTNDLKEENQRLLSKLETLEHDKHMAMEQARVAESIRLETIMAAIVEEKKAAIVAMTLAESKREDLELELQALRSQLKGNENSSAGSSSQSADDSLYRRRMAAAVVYLTPSESDSDDNLSEVESSPEFEQQLPLHSPTSREKDVVSGDTRVETQYIEHHHRDPLQISSPRIRLPSIFDQYSDVPSTPCDPLRLAMSKPSSPDRKTTTASPITDKNALFSAPMPIQSSRRMSNSLPRNPSLDDPVVSSHTDKEPATAKGGPAGLFGQLAALRKQKIELQSRRVTRGGSLERLKNSVSSRVLDDFLEKAIP